MPFGGPVMFGVSPLEYVKIMSDKDLIRNVRETPFAAERHWVRLCRFLNFDVRVS